MKFSDIPQLTRSGTYQVNQAWEYIEEWIAERNECDANRLILEPDFQREHVWNETQQRRYVEYILRGGESGKVLYFNCSSWMKAFNTPIFLVDGLQRLTAVRKFLRNDLKIFDGCYRTDFDGRLPWKAEFLINVNDLPTRKDVLQWYIDLNAGGTPHTELEIDRVRALLDKEKNS